MLLYPMLGEWGLHGPPLGSRGRAMCGHHVGRLFGLVVRRMERKHGRGHFERRLRGMNLVKTSRISSTYDAFSRQQHVIDIFTALVRGR